MRTAWRKAAALAGVVALSGGLLITGMSSPAAGADPPVFVLPDFPGNGGVVRLHLQADGDNVRFDAANGSGYTAGTAQSFTTSGCIATPPAGAPLTITPIPSGGSAQGKLGLVGHSLGVQIKGEGNGTPCGQANGPSQALDLKLAGSLAGSVMDYAELDIEAKFGATVKAELKKGGVTVGTETLPTGGPDSGPDSADRDNYRWRLPESTSTVVLFDEIKLSVDSSTPTGAFSLEGGSDGTTPDALGTTLGTTDSLLHISTVEGTLQCGASTPTEGGGGAPTVTITLRAGAGCQAVPYALTEWDHGEVQAVAFMKVGGPNNTYEATIIWPVEPFADPVPPTQIRYSNADPPHDLVQCGGTATNPAPVTGEAWCRYFQDVVPVGESSMQVTEKLLGNGDPGYWR